MIKLIVLSILALCSANPLKDGGKIVGGDPIDISLVRHQVSLKSNGYHSCGGSIISKNFVLTAAHCVYLSNPSSKSIRIGSNSNLKGGEEITVKRIITHPAYDSWTISNDYALLELSRPIEFNENQGPIELAGVEPIGGDDAVVSGWGNTQVGSDDRSLLRAAAVHIVDRVTCNESYGSITESMICAGEPEGGKDSCQGDSGGPLTSEGRLVGIVSWGRGCALEGYPGVYSNVAYGLNWIIENSDLKDTVRAI